MYFKTSGRGGGLKLIHCSPNQAVKVQVQVRVIVLCSRAITAYRTYSR